MEQGLEACRQDWFGLVDQVGREENRSHRVVVESPGGCKLSKTWLSMQSMAGRREVEKEVFWKRV